MVIVGVFVIFIVGKILLVIGVGWFFGFFIVVVVRVGLFFVLGGEFVFVVFGEVVS